MFVPNFWQLRILFRFPLGNYVKTCLWVFSICARAI